MGIIKNVGDKIEPPRLVAERVTDPLTPSGSQELLVVSSDSEGWIQFRADARWAAGLSSADVDLLASKIREALLMTVRNRG